MNGRRGTTFSKGKAKNAKYTLKKLWNYLYQFRVLLIISFILTILSNVLALLGPSITGKIMNEISAGKSNVNFKNIYYDVINEKIKDIDFDEKSVLKIYVARGCLSKAIGQRKKNKFLLAKILGTDNISFLESDDLDLYEVLVIVERKR